MLTQAPRGTKDVLPADSYRWQYVESKMRQAAAEAGFREVRTPVFEHTELFLRGVGDTTDIVQKEMYTFKDKGDRSITLKPEGTAGVARACWRIISVPTRCRKMYYLNCADFPAMRRLKAAALLRTSPVRSGMLRRTVLRRTPAADSAGVPSAERTGREEPVRQHQLHRLPELPPEVPCNAQIVPVRAHWRNVQHLPDTL